MSRSLKKGPFVDEKLLKKVERATHAFQASSPLLHPSDTSDQVREIRTRPAGYAWQFSGPQRKLSEFESAIILQVDNHRLAFLWALAAVGLSFTSVGLCPELVLPEAAPVASTT